jgi:hypothetical protein
VISPDEDAPFDFNYHPDLQGWLIPETATESGGAIDEVELKAEMVAFVMGIARHHHTKALVRGVGKHGVTFLILVAGGALSEVVGQAIWYWLTHP